MQNNNKVSLHRYLKENKQLVDMFSAYFIKDTVIESNSRLLTSIHDTLIQKLDNRNVKCIVGDNQTHTLTIVLS